MRTARFNGHFYDGGLSRGVCVCPGGAQRGMCVCSSGCVFRRSVQREWVSKGGCGSRGCPEADTPLYLPWETPSPRGRKTPPPDQEAGNNNNNLFPEEKGVHWKTGFCLQRVRLERASGYNEQISLHRKHWQQFSVKRDSRNTSNIMQHVDRVSRNGDFKIFHICWWILSTDFKSPRIWEMIPMWDTLAFWTALFFPSFTVN